MAPPVTDCVESPKRLALITGGAGFIATNLADRLLRDGWRVRLFDNLSCDGVTRNVDWLEAQHAHLGSTAIEMVVGDVRDQAAIGAALIGVDRVFHLAAQEGETDGVSEPAPDRDVDVCGTVNLLEAIRARREPPPLLFASTYKVYGVLDDVPLRVSGRRYAPEDPLIASKGVSEERPLDCQHSLHRSKATADRVVLDYARTYDLPAAVFRMSSIYGPHQRDSETQGWLAHFLVRTLTGSSVTIYGDGLQVRDMLFVEDLVNAMMLAHEEMDAIRGRAFNIGGGPANTVSLLELLDVIAGTFGIRPGYGLEGWRLQDQRYYASDVSSFQQATGWMPRVTLQTGLGRLAEWIVDRRRRPAVAGYRRGH